MTSAEGSPNKEAVVDRQELNLATDFAEILADGHTIHLWNTGGSVRVAEILLAGEHMGEADRVAKLGFGADGTAIQALARAHRSYYKRQAEGKDFLSPEDIRAADAGYATGAPRDGSYLDAVASINSISFYTVDGAVIAEVPRVVTRSVAIGRGDDIPTALQDVERQLDGQVY